MREGFIFYFLGADIITHRKRQVSTNNDVALPSFRYGTPALLDDGSDASTGNGKTTALPQTPSMDDLRNSAALASARGGNASKRGSSVGETLRPRNA